MTRKTPFRRKRFRKAGLMDPELQGLPPEEAHEIAWRKHQEKLAKKGLSFDKDQYHRLRDREWSR